MSAHPAFLRPSFHKQRGRYRDWRTLTSPAAASPEEASTTTTTGMPEEPELSEVPDLLRTLRPDDVVEPLDLPDPDPEVDSALSSGLHRWRVFTRRGDEATTGDDGFAHFRNPVFQQSVTLTAKMWPEDGDGSESASSGWSAWRVSGEHLPLVVGGVAGGALIVMLVVAAVVWRLCVLRRDKQYRVRMGEAAPETRPVQPVMPSEFEVFASPVSGRWAYQSRLLGSAHVDGDCSPRGTSTPPAGLRSPSLGPSLGSSPCPMGTPRGTPQAWVYGDTVRPASASPSISVHRSVSLQLAQQSPISQGGSRRGGGYGGYGRPPGRPLSAVSSVGTTASYSAGCSPATPRHSSGCSPATPRHSAALPPPPPEFLLPDICEFNPAASNQYASSSVLDDSGSLDGEVLPEALRTRSLPASVRNKQKPLASEADLDELYAKVNFSKKRKNRMRHDEAAIIAISKSRSQFLDKMGTDSDTLVDNEAVIVYNERTAL